MKKVVFLMCLAAGLVPGSAFADQVVAQNKSDKHEGPQDQHQDDQDHRDHRHHNDFDRYRDQEAQNNVDALAMIMDLGVYDINLAANLPTDMGRTVGGSLGYAPGRGLVGDFKLDVELKPNSKDYLTDNADINTKFGIHFEGTNEIALNAGLLKIYDLSTNGGATKSDLKLGEVNIKFDQNSALSMQRTGGEISVGTAKGSVDLGSLLTLWGSVQPARVMIGNLSNRGLADSAGDAGAKVHLGQVGDLSASAGYDVDIAGPYKETHETIALENVANSNLGGSLSAVQREDNGKDDNLVIGAVNLITH